MAYEPSAILRRNDVPELARTRWPLIISIALHVVLLVFLLHGRSPVFVAPASVLRGVNGSSITHLYWSTASNHGRATDTSHQAHQVQRRLTWKRTGTELALDHEPVGSEKSDARATAAAGNALAPSAGSPYGSLSEGSGGAEIRPALPVVTSEPLLSPEDLRGIIEGNVVIEITIDEAGNVVSRTVVQSMGPAIDARVLAALENWHFRPATRDDVPIPSKQDVVYHFKPR
jgi:TonB family protein